MLFYCYGENVKSVKTAKKYADIYFSNTHLAVPQHSHTSHG